MGRFSSNRSDRYLQDSKDRLSKILKKKIQTTMIGSLSTIEEHFGFLWESDDQPPEQKKIMKELYEKIRSEILDKGNHQARNIDAELALYTVHWDRYNLELPFIPIKKEQ